MSSVSEAAYRENFRLICSYARRRGRNQSDAEDIAQDVLEATARAVGDARLDGEPSAAWLFTVAHRRLARVRAHPDSAPLLVSDVEGPPRDPLIARTLVEAVQRLPPGQQRVVVLKVIHGHHFAEIAERLGISEQACRMRLVRGLRSLRNELIEKGLEPS